MKCLSIKQPWAQLIVADVKDVENRTWETRYRGPLLIHTGKTVDREAMDYYQSQLREYGIDASARGAIIGVAYLVTIRSIPKSRWHESGLMGWYLRDPVALNVPIPYRGQLGLFDVPDEILPKEVVLRYLKQGNTVDHG